MQIYGYQKNSETLMDLEEVSLKCTLEELEKIVGFLSKALEEHAGVVDRNDICHSHFRDWDSTWREGNPDLIIVTTHDVSEVTK